MNIQRSVLSARSRMRRGDRVFGALVLLGALLRVLAVVGYSPALLYNDTFEYVDVALRLRPYSERPDGYSFFLRALEPAHSFMLVAVLQHLIGLGVAISIYVLARRRFGLPPWAGCVAAAPVLLDGYWIELEEVLLSDTLFTGLLVAAVCVALRQRLTPASAAVGGLLLAAATVTRPAALPALVAVPVYLLLRRDWRAVAALGIALVLPLAGYASWYRADNGRLALDDSTGIQLYGRVAGFADCAKMDVSPTSGLSSLCPRHPGNGLPAPAWLWYQDSPLRQLPGPVFTPAKDRLAMRFAVRAIVHQPGDYLAAVGLDLWHAVAWQRGPYPNKFSSDRAWRFETSAAKAWPLPRGGFEERAMVQYEDGSAATRVSHPSSDILRAYQPFVAVRGPLLAAAMIVTLAGLFAGRKSREAPPDTPLAASPGAAAGIADRWALPLLAVVGFGLALMPIFTVQLDYRYLMPAYPFLFLSATVGARQVDVARGRSSARGRKPPGRVAFAGRRPRAAGDPPTR